MHPVPGYPYLSWRYIITWLTPFSSVSRTLSFDSVPYEDVKELLMFASFLSKEIDILTLCCDWTKNILEFF